MLLKQCKPLVCTSITEISILCAHLPINFVATYNEQTLHAQNTCIVYQDIHIFGDLLV